MATLPKSLPANRADVSRPVKTASVAEAKEHLSALLRSVEQGRGEVVIERRGVAVAKIIPMPPAAPVNGFGWMKGSITETGDIVAPLREKWNVAGE